MVWVCQKAPVSARTGVGGDLAKEDSARSSHGLSATGKQRLLFRGRDLTAAGSAKAAALSCLLPCIRTEYDILYFEEGSYARHEGSTLLCARWPRQAK